MASESLLVGISHSLPAQIEWATAAAKLKVNLVACSADVCSAQECVQDALLGRRSQQLRQRRRVRVEDPGHPATHALALGAL